VQQLLGDESFAAMSRAYWHAAPPARGDIGEWGDGLPAFIAADRQLADEPYLADVARLEWAVHSAERAADGAPAPVGLERLVDTDPGVLWLRLRPGTALVVSPHPIVTVWSAHRSDDADRFAAVRAAFAAAEGENALVLRAGWRAVVRTLPAPAARFTAALIAGRPLAVALSEAGDGFDFESWLVGALQDGAVTAVAGSSS